MTDFDSVLDDGLAVLGVVLVSFPAVAVADALGELPDDSFWALLGLAVLVALVAGPLYRRCGGDIGDLGSFLFALTAVELALGLSVPVAEAFLDLGDASALGSPAGVALVAVSYWAAFWLVYRDGYDRAKTSVRPR